LEILNVHAAPTGSSSKGGCFISNRGGSIIQFLSSNPEELIKKLNTMLAEFQAGNNNVFNHISAIVDELRRQGILSINEIKKLYNSLK
jgi:flagellar motor component MotA